MMISQVYFVWVAFVIVGGVLAVRLDAQNHARLGGPSSSSHGHKGVQLGTSFDQPIVSLDAITYPTVSREGSVGRMQHLAIGVGVEIGKMVPGFLFDTGSGALAICPGLVDLTSPSVRNTTKKGCSDFGLSGTVFEGDIILGDVYVLKNISFLAVETYAKPFCGEDGWPGIFGASMISTMTFCENGESVPPPLTGESTVGISWSGVFGVGMGKVYLGETAPPCKFKNEMVSVPLATTEYIRSRGMASSWITHSFGWKVGGKSYPPFQFTDTAGLASCTLFDTGTPGFGAPEEVISYLIELQSPHTILQNTSTLVFDKAGDQTLTFTHMGSILKSGDSFGAVGEALNCQVMGFPFNLFYNVKIDYKSKTMTFCPTGNAALAPNFVGNSTYIES